MKGTYVILIELDSDETMTIGSLGRMTFPAGFYAYVGSAQAGIERRVSRHRSGGKKLRWHIDYLLEKGTVLATMAVPFGDKGIECEVARKVAEVSSRDLDFRGFGSSDCPCPSHLFYIGGPEEAEAAFEAVYHSLSGLGCVYPCQSS